MFPLLLLPRELRDAIYYHVLEPGEQLLHCVASTPHPARPYKFDIPIFAQSLITVLHANRQLRREVSDVLYEGNIYQFAIEDATSLSAELKLSDEGRRAPLIAVNALVYDLGLALANAVMKSIQIDVCRQSGTVEDLHSLRKLHGLRELRLDFRDSQAEYEEFKDPMKGTASWIEFARSLEHLPQVQRVCVTSELMALGPNHPIAYGLHNDLFDPEILHAQLALLGQVMAHLQGKTFNKDNTPPTLHGRTGLLSPHPTRGTGRTDSWSRLTLIADTTAKGVEQEFAPWKVSGAVDWWKQHNMDMITYVNGREAAKVVNEAPVDVSVASFEDVHNLSGAMLAVAGDAGLARVYEGGHAGVVAAAMGEVMMGEMHAMTLDTVS